MQKIYLFLLLFSMLFLPRIVQAIDLDDCDVINGISVCQESNGTKIILCNPRIHRDKNDFETCRETIAEFNRQKNFYKKQYKRDCSHPYNKRTDYCKNLDYQTTFSIYNYLENPN